MTSNSFNKELEALFKKNKKQRLYNNEFTFITGRLGLEYSYLTGEKLRLHLDRKNPQSSKQLHTIEKRISENRNEMQHLYKITVI